MIRTHTFKGPFGEVVIEAATLVNHPGKWVARVQGMTKEWKGPWKDEATAIRSICQIYSIGGP